ncbi:MAG: DUF2330 domain-containing protein [Acidobacteriota bacterium]
MPRRSTATVLALLLCGSPAYPCAPAPPRGVIVTILDETALILWDEATHTEHFIRGARFQSQASDFGFLVPTPSEPQLDQVRNDLFDRLEMSIQPSHVYGTRFGGVMPTALVCLPYLMMSGGAKSSYDRAGARPPVRVLQERTVSGYDAVVLEADDAGALAAWLSERGYDNRPTLAAWLAPYVAAAYKITAFKVAKAGPDAAFATSAVRMSFHADRPFFPYREPTDQREDRTPRKLFVYFVGTGRVDGAVGAAPWPSKVLWSDRLAAPREILEGALPEGTALPEGAWLTAFEDASSPRPGDDDLFFAPAANTQPYRPPPIVVETPWYVPIPLDVLALAILGVVLWRRRGKRKRAA